MINQLLYLRKKNRKRKGKAKGRDKSTGEEMQNSAGSPTGVTQA